MSLKLSASLFLALGLASACLFTQIFELNSLFEYHRSKVVGGEIWRLLSSNFAHLSWSHCLLNIAALGLLWFLFSEQASWIEWLITILFVSVFTGLGIHLFTLEIERNVGFSGVLHGLAIVGAWRVWNRDQLLSMATFVIVSFKLIYEKVVGPLSDFSEIGNAVVTIDAHLFGATLGLIAVVLLDRFKRSNRTMG